MLLHLKKYLQLHKRGSLRQLAEFVKTDPMVVQLALQHWIRKGQVSCEDPSSKSGCVKRCQGCAPKRYEIYYWIDNSYE